MDYHKHYIVADAAGRIIAGWSDGASRERDTGSAVLLREDGGYQFRLFLNSEENPALTDELGAHCWRWENGTVRESTAAELAQERKEQEADAPAPMPSIDTRMAAMEQMESEQVEANVEFDYRLSMLELG